ncbi:hypothetical protein [Tunturiibacter gelidiferens]|uniref:hypothetical protein n=1 Tax=Tunturiibacter gelidiferens TaxID=3069689 RepID=UPI003D9ADAC4
MVEDHGGGEDQDEPLDAEREKAGVLEFGVDGSDEDGALEEAGDEGAGDQEEDGSDGVGEIGEDEDGDLGFAGEGSVEGGDADEAADGDAAPEDDAGEERCRAMGGDQSEMVAEELRASRSSNLAAVSERRRSAARPIPIAVMMTRASRSAMSAGRKLASL